MATTELVDKKLESGVELLTLLDEMDISVTTAFWLYDAEVDEWRLYLIMPMVETEGPAAAYEKLKGVLNRINTNDGPDLFLRDIVVEGPQSRIAALITRASKSGQNVIPVRLRHNIIDNILIDDVYIYRST